VATRLAESQLNEVLVTGLWETSGQRGVFEEGPSGYSWAMENEQWEFDNMRMISVVVTYLVRNQEYQVRLSTLVDGLQLRKQLEQQRQEQDAAAAEAQAQ